MTPNRQYNTRAIFDLCINREIINKDEFLYRDFYDVVRMFHKEVSKKIIFNEYNFKISLGYFKILRSKRRGSSINWGASNKRKQELIEQNIVPYNKETAPDGVKWFIYHEGDYFSWSWFKDTAATFIKNLHLYTFRAVTGNRRAVGKAIKLNPMADYGIYK